MKIIHKITLIFIILFNLNVKSQVNLVLNSGFEQYSSCPTFGAQWNVCTGWNNINMNTGVGFFGTPDYFNTCGSGGTAPPSTFAGTCNPQAGNAMMAVVIYNVPYSEYREYLSTQLTCSMQPGTTYTLSFWLSNGTGVISPWTIKNIGVHFSNAPLSQSGFNLINVVPQCEITTNVASSGWTQYTFTVNPTSTWSYLSFGSFRDDASNNPIQSYPNLGGPASSYANYFVDDIKVLAPSTATAVSLFSSNGNSALCLGGTTTITASGTGSYTWNTTASGSTIAVSPSVTTTYFVNAILGCSTSSAAITITIAPLPSVSISGPDVIICRGQSVILSAIGATSYTWNSGQLTPSLMVSPNNTTTYSVNGSNAQGCFKSAAYTVSVSVCQSIKETTKRGIISIYPNPFHSSLVIEVSNTFDFSKMVIVNVLGEVVYTFNPNSIFLKNDSKEFKIDLSNLSNGLYFIKIQDSVETFSYKLIKD